MKFNYLYKNLWMNNRGDKDESMLHGDIYIMEHLKGPTGQIIFAREGY